MNDSNPYAPTHTPAHLESTEAIKRRATERGYEVFHNTFRGLLAFLFLGFTPVFVLPKFKVLFAEYGMELPTLAKLVFQFSDLAFTVPIAFVSLSFGLFAAIEFGIFLTPAGRLKKSINLVYWLALVFVIGSVCSNLLLILNKVTSSLASIATTSILTNF